MGPGAGTLFFFTRRKSLRGPHLRTQSHSCITSCTAGVSPPATGPPRRFSNEIAPHLASAGWVLVWLSLRPTIARNWTFPQTNGCRDQSGPGASTHQLWISPFFQAPCTTPGKPVEKHSWQNQEQFPSTRSSQCFRRAKSPPKPTTWRSGKGLAERMGCSASPLPVVQTSMGDPPHPMQGKLVKILPLANWA